MRRILTIILLVCIVSSLPLIMERYKTEQTSKKVQVIFDYRDLLTMADQTVDPHAFIIQQLSKMKAAGIGSIAVYESTLDDLKMSRQIQFYNNHDAALVSPQTAFSGENNTYVLFANKQSQAELQGMITKQFERYGAKVKPWHAQGHDGLMIGMQMKAAEQKPMPPDPLTIHMLQKQGFRIVARLSNREQPFDYQYMDQLLASLKKDGVRWIVFDGTQVTGFSYANSIKKLEQMAYLMNKYHIGAAAVEFTKQNGMTTLARLLHYDVVRLDSLPAKEAALVGGPMSNAVRQDQIRKLNDRFVLAVKERNIRLLYLHAKMDINSNTGLLTSPLQGLYDSLSGPDGAVKRIGQAGYTFGTATPFFVHDRLQSVLQLFAVLGSVILIALMLSYFFPNALLALFVFGGAAALLLYKAKLALLIKMLALGAGISAPTIAVILAIRTLQRWQKDSAAESGYRQAGRSIGVFIRSVAISLSAAVFIVAMMNQIPYFLLLDQFRGVSVLHIVPIFLVTVYLLFYREKMTFKEKRIKAGQILAAPVTVLWVLLAALAAGIGLYYLSRTGNNGHVSSVERLFRHYLQDELGVRPRTKEFLIGHPLFILGAYLSFRYKRALYLFVFGVIGQLSLDDTFAHLHTPELISMIRVVYGVILGIVIGAIFIGIWEVCAKAWNRWNLSERE